MESLNNPNLIHHMTPGNNAIMAHYAHRCDDFFLENAVIQSQSIYKKTTVLSLTPSRKTHTRDDNGKNAPAHIRV